MKNKKLKHIKVYIQLTAKKSGTKINNLLNRRCFAVNYISVNFAIDKYNNAIEIKVMNI